MSISERSKRRHSQRLRYWLLLAGLIHAELMVLVGVLSYFYAPRNQELGAMKAAGGIGETIEISALDEETARKILAELERQDEEKKEEEVKKEVESPSTPGQVVELAKPREEKRPENARFAAEFDASVEKETRRYGKFDEKARQGDSRGQAAETRAAVPPSAPPSDPGKTSGMLAMRSPGAPGRPGVKAPPTQPSPRTVEGPGSDSNAQPDPEGIQAPGARVAVPTAPVGEGGQQGAPPTSPRPPGVASLTPSEAQLAKAIGGGTEDYLKDIDEGDDTALNAKRWKFASFFNRVKQQVREHWKPGEVYRRRDPTGSIYGSKDRFTLLRVQLRPDGTLANVALETKSGIEFLDDEAIEAFKQAQPFPNPPPQLVEAAGTINFRFGFYFELSGAPQFKVFRYNSM